MPAAGQRFGPAVGMKIEIPLRAERTASIPSHNFITVPYRQPQPQETGTKEP